MAESLFSYKTVIRQRKTNVQKSLLLAKSNHDISAYLNTVYSWTIYISCLLVCGDVNLIQLHEGKEEKSN